MNFEHSKKHTIDILFIITLLGAFIVSALLIVVLGAHVYQSTVNDMESNFTTRTAIAYVTEKIRQHDSSGAVSIISVEDAPVLSLYQEFHDVSYYTYLYAYDGYLKEITVKENYPLSLDQGQNILTISDFDMKKLTEHLYSFRITDVSGTLISFYVSIGSDGEEDVEQ